MLSTEKDYIEHHGIKGMRWGVRRTPEQLGHDKPKSKKRMLKKAAVASAVVLGSSLAIYGGIKFSSTMNNSKAKTTVNVGKEVSKQIIEAVKETPVSQIPKTTIPKTKIPTVDYSDYASAMKANQDLLKELLKDLE